MEAMMIYAAVPATAINRLLNNERSKGIHVSCVISIKSLKFAHVGFLTKNFGGYASISFKGLNAVTNTYMMGSSINAPATARNANMKNVPALERLRVFLLLLRILFICVCPFPYDHFDKSLLTAFHMMSIMANKNTATAQA